MRTLLLIAFALPLAAQTPDAKAIPPTTSPKIEAPTPPTPDEIQAYAAMVIQELQFQNLAFSNLRAHKAGNDDLDNADKAHAAKAEAQEALASKHGACKGGDWSFMKRDWVCPVAQPAR